MNHRRFIWEVIGKIGPPLFSAALVACLLSGRFEPLHGVLLAGALAMIAASHWHDHHSRGTTLSR